MERLNGEIRDREKVMRSLKKDDMAILTGMQVFHNYVRPHEAWMGAHLQKWQVSKSRERTSG
jgi:putative transposase